MKVSQSQKEQFEKFGYTVFPGLIPESLLAPVRDLLCDFLGVYLDREYSWKNLKLGGHGSIPVYHDQCLWDIRQYEPLYNAFSGLHGRKELLAIVSRASFKPPRKKNKKFAVSWPFHWDCDPFTFIGESYQGLIYLTDTDESQGPFGCFPYIYQNLDQWLKEHGRKLEKGREIPLELLDISKCHMVTGSAGTLIIWKRQLPHTGILNVGKRPRLSMWVAMDPIRNQKQVKQSVEIWRTKGVPPWAQNQTWLQTFESLPGEPANLNKLGKKIVGIEPWN